MRPEIDIVVLDLDSAVAPGALGAAMRIDLRAWGPRIRLGCSVAQFAAFQRALAGQLAGLPRERAAMVFGGSGDFHHVSLALLQRRRAPVNLLVLDKHPDWVQGVPFLHCGTWLRHVLDLDHVSQIFHVGGEGDFEHRLWGRLSPWPALREGRIVVVPALRHFTKFHWHTIPHQPLRPAAHTPVTPAHLARLLEPYRRALAARPLYISLDKDVLTGSHAAGNWDSGHLTFREVQHVMRAFVGASQGLAGMDVFGDWSACATHGLLRGLLRWEHWGGPHVEAHAARAGHARLNRLLVRCVSRGMGH